MSSHHIVRENQEPALFIIDVDAISDEYLGQLLEWSPTIITIAQNLEILLSRGIKVDAVVGDRMRVSDTQEAITHLDTYSKDLLTPVFDFLLSLNQRTVNILWNEFEKQIFLQKSAEFTFVLFSKNVRYIIANKLEKWLPKARNLVIDEEQHLISTEGLQYIGSDVYLTLDNGFVRVRHLNGKSMCIGEQL